jgi:membrane-bound lytic murein transglycosylase MltF
MAGRYRPGSCRVGTRLRYNQTSEARRLNRTKPGIPLILTLALLLLAACGDGSVTDAPEQQASPAAPSEPAPAPDRAGPVGEENPGLAPTATEEAAQPSYIFRETWTGDLDVMEERRVIRVLTVYGVGRYFLDGAEEKGLIREICDLLERYINKRLKRKTLKVHVVVTPVARDQLVPALLAGQGDIIMAGLSITPERQVEVDFTIPVSKPVSEILVTGPAAPAIASIDELSGQTVYVRHSSSYRESVEALNRRLRETGRAPVEIAPVSELLEDEDLIEMVNGGMLPWAIVDNYKLEQWGEVFADLEPRPDIVFREGAQIAWAFRKESPLLQNALDAFLKDHREGTLTGNVLRNRYYRDFDWAANALEGNDFNRFEELKHIFEKYGEQYSIDYLMVAAQGYQESRLDQNARSHAGAIGVMQMLPSTARDPNVGIPNIEEVDSNIHAAVKYLEFLRERYFSDPGIDDFNRTLLALATYNMGPRNMINVRNKAAKLGYDPDVWFDNVEVVAAKNIGREPVQYVANIFKYYIGYRLSTEQELRRQAARERAGID